MSTIKPLTNISPLNPLHSGSGQNPGQQQHNFSENGNFKAQVLQARGNNTYLLDFSGQQLVAESKTPLQTGQTLNLKITATQPQLEMRIVADSSQNLFQGKPIILLGNTINLQSIFQTLQGIPPSLLHTLSEQTGKTLETFFSLDHSNLLGNESGSFLKDVLDKLGISLEHLLSKGDTQSAKQTLKAALLELATVYKNAGTVPESANTLLNTIEMYQLAQLSLEKDGVFIFPLPFSFLTKGYVLIDDPAQEKAKNKDDVNRHCSIVLNLKGLGNLRIEVLQATNGIYLRIVSPEKEKLAFIEQHAQPLLASIVQAKVKAIHYALEPVDPSLDLLKKVTARGNALINTQA